MICTLTRAPLATVIYTTPTAAVLMTMSFDRPGTTPATLTTETC